MSVFALKLLKVGGVEDGEVQSARVSEGRGGVPDAYRGRSEPAHAGPEGEGAEARAASGAAPAGEAGTAVVPADVGAGEPVRKEPERAPSLREVARAEGSGEEVREDARDDPSRAR
jgi:hypothetical protein